MSTESVCRLCVEKAICYESLYDSNGQKSDVYLLVVKYFGETIINFVRAQHLTVICVKCLQKIQFFDHFQKVVIRAQEKLDAYKEVKRENNLTGYDEEFSSFHINDKSKHDLPIEENNISKQGNNDAVCVRPEESEHIEVSKLEMADALSGDESIQSNHEKFLDCAPSHHSLYTGLSVSADERNQNIDQNASSSIEKSDETNPVNKLKTEIRSPEDIDKNIPKLLIGVECPCVRSEENKHIEVPKLEVLDAFSGDETIQSNHEEFLDYTPSACSVCSDDRNQNIVQNESSSSEKSDETNPVNKLKNKIKSREDIDDYIAKFLPSIECGMCTEKLPTFTHLLEHFKSEHQGNECSAMCCGKRFKNRSLLTRHVHCLHSGPNNYSCKLCTKSFLMGKSLELHMRKHNKNGSNNIQKSDETNPVNKLKNKIKSPEDIDDYIAKFLPSIECGMCTEKLPTFTHLLEHFKSEHQGNECSAMCCGKKFKNRSLLTRHVRCLHSGPNDYTCKLCNKSFLFRKSLSLHMRVHKPIKRKRAPKRSPENIDNFISKLMPTVQCGMCKEKLPTFTHLGLHFKSEHPEKECYAMCCGTVFKMRSRLVRHVYSMHSVSNDYSCKLCTKSFLLGKSLKLHMRKHNQNGSSNIEKSEETNPGDKQKYKMRSPNDVDNYIAKFLPSVECGMCKEKQPTFTHLVQHFKSEHQGNECSAMCCGKSYKRRYMFASHVSSVHSGPNALSCKLCTKSFLLEKSLKLHMRKHNKNASNKIQKSDETDLLDKQKYKIRSPKDVDNYIAKFLPSVECGMCKEKQPTFTHLVQHFKSEHLGNECSAMCCGKRIKTRSLLARHVHCLHSGPNDYTCKLCNKSFLFRKSLSLHMRAHRPIKRKRASKRSPEDIDNFISKLLPRVQCGMCKEKLLTFTHLALHFLSEHPEKECFAMWCGKTIKSRCYLESHVSSSHSALKMDAAIAQLRPSLECVVCKETCTTFSQVQYHFESKHPFVQFYIMCCNRKLKDRPKLLQHLQFHENPNAFKCDICNKRFTQRQYLLNHMRKYHPTSNVGVPKHIEDPTKTSDCNNDAACVRPVESEHIEVPKIEIVDVFSDDDSIQSYHEEFLDSTLNADSVHSGFSVRSFSDGSKQNIDQSDSSSSNTTPDETIYVNKLKNNMGPKRSAEDIDNNIAKILPNIECVMCKEQQPTFTHLLQHFKSEHPAKECYAVCCGKKFKKRSLLAIHVNSMHCATNAFLCSSSSNKTPDETIDVNKLKNNMGLKRSAEDIDNNIAKILPNIECVMCKEQQPTFTHLVQHFKSEHPAKECYAVCCGKKFKKRSLLAIHVNSMHCVTNAYPCSSSSNKTPDETINVNKLKNNMGLKRSAEDIDNNIAKILPNIECVMCKEQQPTFTHLLQHFKSEHPAKECYAVCCGKKFKKRSLLAIHVNSMHCATDAYPCKHCNKIFLLRKSLILHMRAHISIPHRSRKDIDDYVAKFLPSVECGVCREKQPTFTHLALHFTAEHPATECYTMCCGTTIKKRGELAHHVSRAHSTPRDTACKSIGSPTDAAIAHLRPNLECVMCKETCTTFALLQNHFEIKHPFDEFYIMCCKRKLKDRSHLLQHLQFHENPNAFKCNVCNKCFSERSSLLRHMRVSHHKSSLEIPKRINSRRKTSEYNNVALSVGSDKTKHVEVQNL